MAAPLEVVVEVCSRYFASIWPVVLPLVAGEVVHREDQSDPCTEVVLLIDSHHLVEAVTVDIRRRMEVVIFPNS